ncbi:MAG: hypothetical protein ACFFD4_02610 [Candidatus Odinarchaeota archaeon]
MNSPEISPWASQLRQIKIQLNYNDANNKGSAIETLESVPIDPGKPVDLELMLHLQVICDRIEKKNGSETAARD